ncbi:hypothetical protein ACTXT7_014925 [Hymenolepis weldensis]
MALCETRFIYKYDTDLVSLSQLEVKLFVAKNSALKISGKLNLKPRINSMFAYFAMHKVYIQNTSSLDVSHVSLSESRRLAYSLTFIFLARYLNSTKFAHLDGLLLTCVVSILVQQPDANIQAVTSRANAGINFLMI